MTLSRTELLAIMSGIYGAQLLTSSLSTAEIVDEADKMLREVESREVATPEGQCAVCSKPGVCVVIGGLRCPEHREVAQGAGAPLGSIKGEVEAIWKSGLTAGLDGAMTVFRDICDDFAPERMDEVRDAIEALKSQPPKEQGNG